MRYALQRLVLAVVLSASVGAAASAQGEVYCSTSPNSAGAGAMIRWLGLPDVLTGRILVDGLPRNASGLFLYGYTGQQTPFGNGFSCIGGPRRVLARKRAVFGSVLLDFDLESDPGALRTIQQSINIPVSFQYMYRDPRGGGARFNLSNAIRVHLGGAGT